ncbi:hypothetical protein GGF31_003620 [Allomyces arbusculus]|nr:hypothetical protein GGF31_003620 [Allomyces arbusculus]
MGRIADASAVQDGKARQRAVFTNGSASTTMPALDATDGAAGTTSTLLSQLPGPDMQQELAFGVPVRSWRLARSFLCTMYLLMGAGIIYLFSSYGTQLRDRFEYSQLEVSMVASSANLGLYLSGPAVGWLIDRYGPRPVAIVGSLMMFFGFLGVSTAVNTEGVMFPAWLLCGLYFFVGSGSSGCTLPSIALNVRAFPAQVRGFAVGVPLSLYGLSAFIFVQIKSAYFDADSSADTAVTGGDLGGFLTTITAFLGVGVFLALVAMWDVPLEENVVEPIAIAADELGSDEEEAVVAATTAAPHKIQGLGEYLTFRSSQLLIATFFFAAGTGLMIIGNVGAVVLALAPPGHGSDDPGVQKLQGTQVALLSMFNALGRVIAGVGSDFTAARFGVSRAWWLLSSVVIMAIAQAEVPLAVAAGDTWAFPLGFATAMTGYAYGTLWSLCPSLVAEWVSPVRFGFIWGTMTCVPALSQQVTNTLFGALYDMHRPPVLPGEPPAECKGASCFAAAYWGTAAMCVVGAACAFALAMRPPPAPRGHRSVAAEDSAATVVRSDENAPLLASGSA